MTRPWIKFHTTKLDDTRLLRLNDRQQLRYYQLYLLAGRLDADGLFIENGKRLDETDIAIKLRISDVKQFATDLSALKKSTLIRVNGHGPCIEAFGHEQVSKEDMELKREKEREKKTKQRAAKRPDDVPEGQERDKGKSRKRPDDVPPLEPDQKKKKIKKKKEIKNQPSPTPSSKRGKAALVGGGSKKSFSTSSLSPEQKQIAEIIAPILTAVGLGRKKLESLIVDVATRIKPSDVKRYTLAALASVYSDPDVRKPPVVIAHRMMADAVPVLFMNSSTWRIIPAEILKVADVELERLPNKTINNDVVRKVAANVSAR